MNINSSIKTTWTTRTYSILLNSGLGSSSNVRITSKSKIVERHHVENLLVAINYHLHTSLSRNDSGVYCGLLKLSELTPERFWLPFLTQFLYFLGCEGSSISLDWLGLGFVTGLE
jgi:hypothetical protein